MANVVSFKLLSIALPFISPKNILKIKISLGNLASYCKMILEFIWAISSLENSQSQTA